MYNYNIIICIYAYTDCNYICVYRCDKTGDGKINYIEFAKYLTGKLCCGVITILTQHVHVYTQPI